MADNDPTPLRQTNAGALSTDAAPTSADGRPITDEDLGQTLAAFMDQRIEAAIAPLRDEIVALRQRLEASEQESRGD